MLNEDRLKEIAKPRDKKAHIKFVLWYKFRWVIMVWQDLQLYYYKITKNK